MYKDRYLEYLEAVPDIIRLCKETGRRPLLAYASNLDVLVQWDAEKFNRFLAKYLKEEPSVQEGETVKSPEDLARILSYYVIHGLGGETDLVSQKAADALYEFFEMEEGLGGTCAQGAAALGSMGFPVLVHLTDRSRQVIEKMSGIGIESVKDGQTAALEQCIVPEKPLQHFIVQFTKDDLIKVFDREYRAGLSNRLIMGYDQVHKILPVDEGFLAYCEEHAQNICSYDISGFNAITDPDILKERLERLTRHYAAVKEKNPLCRIYLESAHFISSRIRAYTFEVLAPFIDLLGMNEEELVDLTRAGEKAADPENLSSILEGLEKLLAVYPVEGIVVHSKDYALYYGAELPGVDLEMGLTLGNLISGTRARTGRYGTPADCRQTLQLSLSSIGLAFAEELERKKETLPHTAVLVPSRYMEKPAATIGLGDSFVAGMQICFIR